MNNMTITDANRKFTHLIRQVDSEGLVGITKGGKVKYILMTRKEYEKMNITFGKVGESLLCIERGETDKLWKIDADSFVMYESDKDSVTIEDCAVKMEAKTFFRMKYWDDAEDPCEESEKVEALRGETPSELTKYELSVKTKNKVWE